MTDSDWVSEGCEVAVVSYGFGSDRVTFTTVARLTATQVVLENGSKFRRSDLRQIGKSGYSFTRLTRPDDEQVLGILRDQTRRDAIYRVMSTAEDLRNKDADEQLALLDRLVEEVGSAHAAVAAFRDANR